MVGKMGVDGDVGGAEGGVKPPLHYTGRAYLLVNII
jgi:hypothetical protein